MKNQTIAQQSIQNGEKYLRLTARHLFIKEDGSYMYVKEKDEKFYLVQRVGTHPNESEQEINLDKLWSSCYDFSGGVKQYLRNLMFYRDHGYVSVRWKKRRDIKRNKTI